MYYSLLFYIIILFLFYLILYIFLSSSSCRGLNPRLADANKSAELQELVEAEAQRQADAVRTCQEEQYLVTFAELLWYHFEQIEPITEQMTHAYSSSYSSNVRQTGKNKQEPLVWVFNPNQLLPS